MIRDIASLLEAFTSIWDNVMPDDLPLLDVFTCLREKYSMPLGVEDYLSALRALCAGIGWENRQALQQLCCMLWAKSENEAHLVCRVMDRVLTEHASRVQAATTPQMEPEPQAPKAETAPLTSSGQTTPTAIDAVWEGVEPIRVVQAIRRSISEIPEIHHFQLLTEYFPVTQRQMKQSWRHLRRKIREGPLEELDVDATVKKAAREGVILEPVLQSLRVNRAELVLLIDQGGSMVPFHNLSRQLRETAWRDGRLGHADVYYFHDYPAKYLYTDPSRLEGKPTDDVLARLSVHTAVLIISDAGAARGKLDAKRIDRTEHFIQKLKQTVRYYAWLNPMPNTRWVHTTAEAIAHQVPMFEMSRQGLDAAISALRGRYVYWEKLYPWMT